MGQGPTLAGTQETASAYYEQGRQKVADARKGWEELPPPGKSAQIGIGFCNAVSEDPDECPFIHTLKCELANSYYWTGRCFLDLLYFWCQWHPLLGIFLCHPNHPWTKWERFLQTIVSLALTMVPSAFIGKLFAHDPFGRLIFVLLFVTVPDTIIGVLLYQISIAGTRGACCSVCAPFWKMCSQCCGITALIIGSISTLLCYNILQVNGQTQWKLMLGPLVQGKVISYATWIPIWLILPCQLGFLDLWNFEKRAIMSGTATPAEQREAMGRSGAE